MLIMSVLLSMKMGEKGQTHVAHDEVGYLMVSFLSSLIVMMGCLVKFKDECPEVDEGFPAVYIVNSAYLDRRWISYRF